MNFALRSRGESSKIKGCVKVKIGGKNVAEYVLITGATGGLGKEFARLFAKDGYNLLLTGRNQDKLEQVKNEIYKMYPVEILTLKKDLGESNASQELGDWVKAKNLIIDALVNNAGFGDSGEFVESDINRQKEMVQLNITAVMELSHLLGQVMKERGKGKILNIASAASLVPGPMMATYYATKAFVLSFGMAICEELQPYGVTVTTLCPGPISTGFWESAKAEENRVFSAFSPAKAEKVARRGYKAMQKGKAIVYYGWLTKGTNLAARVVSRKLGAKATKRINSIPKGE